MLNLYPRLAAGGAVADDDDENRVCYGIMVACVLLLLLCVLLAVVSIAWACAITGVIVVLFALIGWFAPTGGVATQRNASGEATQQPAAAAPAVRLVRRCACRLADAAIGALPTFAYESPAGKGRCGDEGSGKPRGSCLLCAVCLEDVQAGEMVRQLPVCCHLFHVDCIDMWLHTHQTCPLCRCELLPRKATAKAAAAAAAATESSADVLPPV